MPAFDWPLTAFTLITQLVLGAFAVLWVTDQAARHLARPEEQEYLTRVGVWLLGPLMAVGFAVSMLHLGQPMFAFRALSNPATSWLSREILSLGAFFVLGGGYALLWWRWQDKFALRASYGAVVAVVGAVGLVSMVGLYLLPAMPTWNNVATPLAFVASALLLGPVLVAAVFTVTYGRHHDQDALRPLIRQHLGYMAVTVLVGAVLAGAALAIQLAMLPRLGLEGEASLALLTSEHVVLFGGRVAMLLAAVALAALVLRQVARSATLQGTPAMVWGLFAVVAASELLGRLLFYASAVPVRPPDAFF